MAEFVEVIKEFNRMCNSHFKCRGCELEIRRSDCGIHCYEYMVQFPQEAEEIIMDWAKEHPVMTNADKFEEVFGHEPTDSCPFETTACGVTLYCRKCPHKDFWEQEWKDPKEKADKR